MKKKCFFNSKLLSFSIVAFVLAILVTVIGVQFFTDGFGGYIKKGSTLFSVITVLYTAAALILVGVVVVAYYSRIKFLRARNNTAARDISALKLRKATVSDTDGVCAFYDGVIDNMNAVGNLALWKKENYPSREYFKKTIEEGTYVVGEIDGKIVAAVNINDDPCGGYENGMWGLKLERGEYLVIHTLAVSPEFKRCGIAKRLVEYAASEAKKLGKKAVRLDVTLINEPAMKLYESSGFVSAGVADLGREESDGIKAFQLYELAVTEE